MIIIIIIIICIIIIIIAFATKTIIIFKYVELFPFDFPLLVVHILRRIGHEDDNESP